MIRAAVFAALAASTFASGAAAQALYDDFDAPVADDFAAAAAGWDAAWSGFSACRDRPGGCRTVAVWSRPKPYSRQSWYCLQFSALLGFDPK